MRGRRRPRIMRMPIVNNMATTTRVAAYMRQSSAATQFDRLRHTVARWVALNYTRGDGRQATFANHTDTHTQRTHTSMRSTTAVATISNTHPPITHRHMPLDGMRLLVIAGSHAIIIAHPVAAGFVVRVIYIMSHGACISQSKHNFSDVTATGASVCFFLSAATSARISAYGLCTTAGRLTC